MSSLNFSIKIFVLFCLLEVISNASIEPNRGDNANGDNDEAPTTLPPAEPPIQHQFAVVSSKLVGGPRSKVGGPVRKVQQVAENAEKEDDTDDADAGAEEEASGEETSGIEERRLRAAGKKRVKQAATFQGAVDCGYHRLRAGQAMSIQSINFNSGGTYRNFYQCNWRFFGQQCRVKARCPCFDLPQSPDCNGDFLKVTDLYSFAHKFCGDSRPAGTYNSTTNNLKIFFRSDGQRNNDPGQGFLCYVTCTGYGKPDPPQLFTDRSVCPAPL